MWEGSFRYVPWRVSLEREPEIKDAAVILEDPRHDPEVIYPIVEFDQMDPLFRAKNRDGRPLAAITGLVAYRDEEIPELKDKLLFGDIVSGEVFFVDLTEEHDGGQDRIRRVVFSEQGEVKPLLEMISKYREELGLDWKIRTDLRFGSGPDGQVFILNKRDGVIRRLGSAPYSTCGSP